MNKCKWREEWETLSGSKRVLCNRYPPLQDGQNTESYYPLAICPCGEFDEVENE